MKLVQIRNAQGAYILPFVVIALSVLDIVLLELKYNLFSGGFLLAERIGTVGARLTFAGAVFAVEFGLAGCFWYLSHIIGSLRGARPLQTRFLFLLVYGCANVAIIALKYRVLSYFGDFLSMAVVRNLGGGSLVGALMYGAYEILLAGAWFVPVVTLAWYLHRVVNRYARAIESPRNQPSIRQLSLRMSACMIALLTVSVAASANHSMRKYLAKTTPYALAHAVVDNLVAPEASVLATFAASVAAPPTGADAEIRFGQRKDHLVLIVSESTRADVLSAESNGSPVAVNWRQIAAEGSAAENYYSHTGFTSSSLKAIFLASLGKGRPLGGSLFEILKKNGYQIVVISGQDESFGNIAGESGSEKLADVFFDARSAKPERVFSSADSGSLALSNGRVVKEFEAVSGKIDWRKPVFVYINLQAAHFPYYHAKMPRTVEQQPLLRNEINQDSGRQLRNTYLNAVAYSDWATGRIVARLKGLGVYGQTLLAVSGDHGESLFDDGVLGHGIRLDDNQMKTLLVANRSLPGFAHLLGQTDLAAQLLQGIGAKLGSFPEARNGVLQIIGSIQSPSQLGYVYPDGRRLSIDNENREIHASWLVSALPVAGLRVGSKEHGEVTRLVGDWKTMTSASTGSSEP
jgi:glucan phosphoethanolaminetransferase (alkaline phosphatase superfamily)